MAEGGQCSQLRASPGSSLPGGPGRPLLQAVPDLQPELHRVGQPGALHPDLTVAPALQPSRYLAPKASFTPNEAVLLVGFPLMNPSLIHNWGNG